FVSGSVGAAPGDRIIQSKDGIDFVIPVGSRMTVAAMGEYTDISFSGAFTLSGTFTYGFTQGSSGETGSRFVFRPDAASARLLPHWPRALADAIRFSNEAEFLAAAVPKAQLAAMRASGSGTVSGRVSVRAGSWHAVLGCGDAYYSARFVEVRTPS